MKFKIVASLVLIAAIFGAVVLSAALEPSKPNRPAGGDGIRINR